MDLASVFLAVLLHSCFNLFSFLFMILISQGQMLTEIKACSSEQVRKWLNQRITDARWAEQMRADFDCVRCVIQGCCSFLNNLKKAFAQVIQVRVLCEALHTLRIPSTSRKFQMGEKEGLKKGQKRMRDK